ncbi:MAG TPA: hypothetical protein VHV55_25710, partial [Pirellulales bacterium]|nr:hypothetical protein [Pirellulales bacterium]
MLRAPRWGANGNVTYYTYDHLGQQTSVSVPAQPTSEEGWLEFGSDTTQSATSTYQYSQTGLTPGMYEVLVNWVADPSLDHYAGYGVSAPGQFIGYDVDQRQSPDPSGLNGGWYSLGDILVTGNELDMSLSGDRLAPTYVGDWEIIRVSNVATITTYDADGRVTGTTDPLANTTSYSYNALGEKTVENDPNPNDGGWTAQETFTYNADGQMLTSTETPNAGGIVDTTNYSYDHLGRQTSVSSPSITIDNSSASGYGSSGGFSLTASDPEPQPSGYNGNSVLFGDGTATWTFDDVDPGEYEVLATWQPFSNASNSAAYEIIDGSNVLGTATVDQTQSPNGSLQAGWQQLGAQFTVASGTLVVQLPSIAGQLVEADAIRLVRVSDQTTYTYNALGTQTSETDADGNLTTFAYNSIGQLLSETDPTGGVTSYTY